MSRGKVQIELDAVEEESLRTLGRELGLEPEALARAQVRQLLEAAYLAGLDELLAMGDPVDREWVARQGSGLTVYDRVRRRFGLTALREKVRDLRQRLDADTVAAGILVQLEAAGLFIGDLLAAAETDAGAREAARRYPRPPIDIHRIDPHYCSACRRQIERKAP